MNNKTKNHTRNAERKNVSADTLALPFYIFKCATYFMHVMCRFQVSWFRLSQLLLATISLLCMLHVRLSANCGFFCFWSVRFCMCHLLLLFLLIFCVVCICAVD